MGDYVGNSADGMVYGAHAVYATARSTSTGFSITSATDYGVGQRLSAGTYTTYRGFLKFDTSAIPDNSDINSVKLRLSAHSDDTDTDFDLEIVKFDWSAFDPITAANREAAYDGALAALADDNIWRNTAGVVLDNPYESGDLDPLWINKTGYTYYALRSKNDYDNVAPVGSENIGITTAEYSVAEYRPYLVITYTPPHYKKCCMILAADIRKIMGFREFKVKKLAGE